MENGGVDLSLHRYALGLFKRVVKERPILFSGDMVRAIIEGRKTQTRRVVKIHPMAQLRDGPRIYDDRIEYGFAHPTTPHGFSGCTACPYGQPGDRLWVRETWQHFGNSWTGNKGVASVKYRADDKVLSFSGFGHKDLPTRSWWNTGRRPWAPAIHMPRWASRITLEIVSVKVERLQEISDDDCVADLGCLESLDDPSGEPAEQITSNDVRADFRKLWDSLNSKRGLPWSSNPWVWVIEFRKV